MYYPFLHNGNVLLKNKNNRYVLEKFAPWGRLPLSSYRQVHIGHSLSLGQCGMISLHELTQIFILCQYPPSCASNQESRTFCLENDHCQDSRLWQKLIWKRLTGTAESRCSMAFKAQRPLAPSSLASAVTFPSGFSLSGKMCADSLASQQPPCQASCSVSTTPVRLPGWFHWVWLAWFRSLARHELNPVARGMQYSSV